MKGKEKKDNVMSDKMRDDYKKSTGMKMVDTPPAEAGKTEYAADKEKKGKK